MWGCVCACTCMLSCFTCVWLFVTLRTVAHQAPLSMGFSRQGYWSGLPCPPLRDLPDPGIKPTSLMSPALTDGLFITSIIWEAPMYMCLYKHIYETYILYSIPFLIPTASRPLSHFYFWVYPLNCRLTKSPLFKLVLYLVFVIVIL